MLVGALGAGGLAAPRTRLCHGCLGLRAFAGHGGSHVAIATTNVLIVARVQLYLRLSPSGKAQFSQYRLQTTIPAAYPVSAFSALQCEPCGYWGVGNDRHVAARGFGRRNFRAVSLPAHAEKLLKINESLGPGSPEELALLHFKKLVEEGSKGEVKIAIHFRTRSASRRKRWRA